MNDIEPVKREVQGVGEDEPERVPGLINDVNPGDVEAGQVVTPSGSPCPRRTGPGASACSLLKRAEQLADHCPQLPLALGVLL